MTTLSVSIGGARETFDERVGVEVADVLDRAFGAEREWEGVAARRFGELAPECLTELHRRALEDLGEATAPGLAATIGPGTGVFLPAQLRSVTLPMSVGGPLRCASLPALRDELAALAVTWDLPLDDEALFELLRVFDDPEDGPIAEFPEVVTYALLTLAANEAVRRDCPLWLIG